MGIRDHTTPIALLRPRLSGRDCNSAVLLKNLVGSVDNKGIRGRSTRQDNVGTGSSDGDRFTRLNERTAGMDNGDSGHTGNTITDSRRRKLLLLASDSSSHALALLALVGILSLFKTELRLAAEIAAALTLSRILIHHFSRPLPVLTVRPVCKYLRQLIDTESKFLFATLALTFVMAWPVPRAAILIFAGTNIVLQCGFFYIARRILSRLVASCSANDPETARNRVLVVGTGPRARKITDMILSSPELETHIHGFLDYRRRGLWRYRDLPLLGDPERLEEIASTMQLDAVVLAVEPDELARTGALFAAAERMGITVSFMPDLHRPQIGRAVPASLNGTPTIAYRAVPENRITLTLKSLIDRIGAVVGIVLAAPIMLITALAIKLESCGPVFFTQTRSGINGRTFRLLKFRTMCMDAEGKRETLSSRNEMSGPVFKIRNDPRITRIGGLLRKYSIDEIPQFINVLRGEMSLVGPRPPLPSEVAKYKPWQRRKLSVKPGLTCIWQVNGRNQIDFEDWMRLDLEYIDNWSLWLDTKILARTVPTVLKGSGAA